MPYANNAVISARTPEGEEITGLNRQCISACSRCSTRRVCSAVNLADEVSTRQLGNTLHTHRLNSGAHIFHAGEKPQAIYVVKSGMFKAYLITESGDERVISFYLPGEVIGIDAFAQGKHRVSAMAIESSSLCSIPIADLLKKSPSDWLVKLACQEILRERQSFLIASRKHCADAKVALFLLNLSQRNHSRGYAINVFKLSMPRRDLANHLDLALETVSRVLTRLQELDILTLNRRQVTINDTDCLLRIAGIEREKYSLDYD